MMNIIETHFNSILIFIVTLVAIGALRSNMDRLYNLLFNITLIVGGYIGVATFFPNDVPQLLGSSGMMVLATVAVIVFLVQSIGLSWEVKILRNVVLFISVVSLYQLVVVGFMFNGTAPGLSDWTLRFQASSDSYTTALMFGGAGAGLLAIYLINRRVRINRDESDHRSDHRNLDVRDHDMRHTITQTVPQLALVQIKSDQAPIYRTPSQRTTKTVNQGMTFRAMGRTGDNQKLYLMHESGQAIWTETAHIEFLSGNLSNVPPLETGVGT